MTNNTNLSIGKLNNFLIRSRSFVLNVKVNAREEASFFKRVLSTSFWEFQVTLEVVPISIMKLLTNAPSDENNVYVEKKVKKKRKNHSQLGKDFVAPDSGYGWFICMAAGSSNVRMFY